MVANPNWTYNNNWTVQDFLNASPQYQQWQSMQQWVNDPSRVGQTFDYDPTGQGGTFTIGQDQLPTQEQLMGTGGSNPLLGGTSISKYLTNLFGIQDPAHNLSARIPDALPGSLMPEGSDLAGMMLALAPVAAMVGGFAGVGGLSNAGWGEAAGGLGGGSTSGFGFGSPESLMGAGSDIGGGGMFDWGDLLQNVGGLGDDIAWDPSTFSPTNYDIGPGTSTFDPTKIAWTDVSGSGGGSWWDMLTKGAGNLASGLTNPTGGGMNWGSLIGAILGATTGKPADIRTETTPWNASFWGAPQQAATDLMNNNKLVQPEIPTLNGLPDIANTDSLNAAIQAAIAPMRQNFFDPGGTLSQIRSEFGDQYGSTKHDQATGLAAGREALAEGQVGAKMTNDLYGINLAYNKDRALQDILNTQWGFGQATNQADKAFQAPWTNVLNAGNLFSAASGKGSTTVQPMPSTPWWQTAAGGAMAGTDLWNKVFKP